VAVWRFFASTKTHGERPEVIERPLGTTVLYIVLCLCLFGCIAGLIPMQGDCKWTCGAETHGNYVITIVSASIACRWWRYSCGVGGRSVASVFTHDSRSMRSLARDATGVAPRAYGVVMSDFLNKAKDAIGDLKGNPLLDKAEDLAESKAAEGGTIGAIADKVDDAIDQIQGTKD
jgi:hypothetical protein